MAVAKVIELIGVSDNGWEDAVRNAVRDASKSINNITGVEVISTTGNVVDGELTKYKAIVKVVFGLTDR
jgi:dodecin